MRRALHAILIGLSLATVVVFADPRPASAYVTPAAAPVLIANPVVAGTAVIVGGALVVDQLLLDGAGSEWVAEQALNIPGVDRALSFLFGEPEVEAEVIPAATTTYGGGCWQIKNGVNYATANGGANHCTTGTPLSLQLEDGIAYTDSAVNLAGTITKAPATSSDTEAKVKVEWSGTMSSTSLRNKVRLTCFNGSTSQTTDWDVNSDALNLGILAGGSMVKTFAAGLCVSLFGSGYTKLSVKLYTSTSTIAGEYRYQGTSGTPESLPAPDYFWRSTKTCTTGGPHVDTSAEFKEADDPMPIFPNPSCVPGAYPLTWKVDQVNADTLVVKRTVVDWAAPASWADPTGVEFSDCLPGGSAHPCTVRLLKTSAEGLLDCSRADVDCTSFDPVTSTELQYQCRWGSHVVALTDCAHLVDLQLAPEPDAGTGTGTGTDADTVNPENGVLEPGQTNAECMGGGWGWNPIEWVLKPVKCALVWAFVPDQSLMTQVEDAYNGSIIESMTVPVTEVAGTIDNFSDAANVSEDCSGPSAEVPLGSGSFTFEPLNSCQAPASTAAATVKTGLRFVFYVFGGLAVARIVLGSFGFHMGSKGGETA